MPFKQGTQSLGKAFQILREIAAHDTQGVRLTDLGSALGLEPPTAHRLLGRLVGEQMVVKDERGRYHLGRQVFELGLLAAHRFAVPAKVEALIERAAHELGDTAFLTVRTGLQMVCLTRKEGSYPIKVVAMAPGTRRYLGLGVSGVALLAKMPREEAEAILKENQSRFGEFGSASLAKVKHRVEFARRAGYAVSESYFTKGVGGIGVAVPTQGATPVFSLSLVGLTNRFRPPRRDEVVSTMNEVAGEIAVAFS